MNRRSFFAALGGAAAVPFAAKAEKHGCSQRLGNTGRYKGFPSLSPFSNRFIAPEAIMPLRRDADGRLGVLDPEIVAEHIKTEEGEWMMLNVIRRDRMA